nr:TIGR02328 family protein [uncultured Lachnoanaerobaculum sp.]
MRLWHEKIISLLPKNQLLGQHRECCALRGNGWKKKHKTVDYVFSYSPYLLFRYHLLVMEEMEKRGYNVSEEWKDKNYRGKIAEKYMNLEEEVIEDPIYKEHNNKYLDECIENLRNKGIQLKL